MCWRCGFATKGFEDSEHTLPKESIIESWGSCGKYFDEAICDLFGWSTARQESHELSQDDVVGILAMVDEYLANNEFKHVMPANLTGPSSIVMADDGEFMKLSYENGFWVKKNRHTNLEELVVYKQLRQILINIRNAGDNLHCYYFRSW